MLLTSYKNILPASIALIGGVILTVGLPHLLLENNIAEYTPSGPEPKTTQGGGSRLLDIKRGFLSSQPLAPQASTVITLA
jgi:hypothetical protein